MPRPAIAIVCEVVARALDLPQGAVAPTTRILELPGFASSALLGLVDGLEDALGVVVPVERMRRDDFATPDALVAALARDEGQPWAM